MNHAEEFFAFARKRHQIYLDRQAGKPWPWTDDAILSTYSFTNVFRELDKVTVWFKNNIREPMRSSPAVLLATITFRWFNRPQTGSAIFKQQLDFGHGCHTPWETFLRTGDTEDMKTGILNTCGSGPYVNGAYIILGQQGMSKLDGVLACIQTVAMNSAPGQHRHWEEVAKSCLSGSETLETVWDWLRRYPYSGDFMAYEVVTDLRHTDLLCNAPDILTWANPGPGAERGLARVTGRGVSYRAPLKKVSKAAMIEEMRELLKMSRRREFWPQRKGWPALEMREIEHTLCEFDKYERTRTNEGTPKARYRYRG